MSFAVGFDGFGVVDDVVGETKTGGKKDSLLVMSCPLPPPSPSPKSPSTPKQD